MFKEELKKIKYRNILDIIMVVLLFFTCVKKGGFYKSDVLLLNLVITAIGIIYLCINQILSKKGIISVSSIFIFLFGCSYFIPILFRNNVDMSDSIFEMIRYFNFYIIYKIVSQSTNKKIYENGIVVVTFLECIIGIDGIGKRYLENVLNLFNSGFLEKDFTRVSGTIQYANVFAILCAISLLIITFRIIKEKKNNHFFSTCYFFIFSVLLLTESRAVTILYIIFLVYYIIFSIRKNKDFKTSIIIFLNSIFSIIFTACVYNYCLYNIAIYILTGVFVSVMFIINYMLFKLSFSFLEKVNFKKCFIGVVIFSILYIIISLNVTTNIYMSDNIDREVTRNIYNVKKGSINNIRFKVEEKKLDSNYTIKLFEVLENLEVRKIREVGYFSTSTGVFDIDFKLDDNVKYVKLEISCENGSIVLDDMYMNNKSVKLNYVLVPSSIVYRIQDILNGSTSITDRFIFTKDAIAIITATPKNFIIGIGGEGFKNTYELYQKETYISSEVHNSFLQIFVETGIIGVSCIFIAIIYTFIKCNERQRKLLLMLFIIHLFFDLELSYFSMIYVLAILLALCIRNDKAKIKINKYMNYFCVPVIVCLCVIFIILFKANIAYSIDINNDENIDIYAEQSNIKTLETRVLLDSYDVNYRIELNKEYEKYLKLLIKESSIDNKVKLEEIEKVIISIKENSNIMLENSIYNKFVIVNVCNVYINNLDYFAFLYGQEFDEEHYIEYINYILNNLKQLEKHKYNKIAQDELLNLYNNLYFVLKAKNISINSLKLEKLLDILEEKRVSLQM